MTRLTNAPVWLAYRDSKEVLKIPQKIKKGLPGSVLSGTELSWEWGVRSKEVQWMSSLHEFMNLQRQKFTFENNPRLFGVSITHEFGIIFSKHCYCSHHAPVIGLPCFSSHVKHKNLKSHRHMFSRLYPGTKVNVSSFLLLEMCFWHVVCWGWTTNLQSTLTLKCHSNSVG